MTNLLKLIFILVCGFAGFFISLLITAGIHWFYPIGKDNAVNIMQGGFALGLLAGLFLKRGIK